MTIEELLHRRGDLSTFLVHLTRAGMGFTARQNLLSIIAEGVIEARTPLGMAREHEAVLARANCPRRLRASQKPRLRTSVC